VHACVMWMVLDIRFDVAKSAFLSYKRHAEAHR